MANVSDGGAVIGTGGGKFGAPMRWKRPANARLGTTVWGTTVLVAGIGDAVRGRRVEASLDLVIGESPEGWVWYVRGQGRARDGKAANCKEAASAAVSAAKELCAELAARPRESANHPSIGPAVWPGER